MAIMASIKAREVSVFEEHLTDRHLCKLWNWIPGGQHRGIYPEFSGMITGRIPSWPPAMGGKNHDGRNCMYENC